MSGPGPGVEVRRFLDASPDRVFAAFSDAALVARWLRPSPDIVLTVLALDHVDEQVQLDASLELAALVARSITGMVMSRRIRT
ncbi:MAG TPA: hypothetical protein VKB80_35260 [Kofleriaceae bacterium]|nr:hypothetical protein [Kofleriaceae bacterium]